MAESDLISVVIPVYRVEKNLEQCIRSVVNQSYRTLEIILVDDGSPDQCGKICDEWAEKDKRIKVIHKENGGLSDARNVGLDIATGEYVGFVDGDDFVHPEMYQRLYEKSKEYNADLTMCNYYRVDEQNKSVIHIENVCEDGLIDKKVALRYLCRYSPYIVVWNKLYKRCLFQGLRFPIGKIVEDLYVMPRLYDRCSKILCISDKYYYYVQTPNSISRGNKTIRHLDGVEAYYEYLLYCEKKDYSSLAQEIVYRMVDYYMGIMNQIAIESPNEKERVHEIKRMIRYGYLKYGSEVRLLHRLYVEFPVVYNTLMLIKRKLLNSPGKV